jgi:hypothetical protein
MPAHLYKWPSHTPPNSTDNVGVSSPLPFLLLLAEALEKLLADLPQTVRLSLQQLFLLERLHPELHLKNCVDDLGEQFFGEHASQPDHQYLVEEDSP